MQWQGRARFVVLDTCYGTGEYVRTLIDAWRADPQRPARLHVIAVCAIGSMGAAPGCGMPGFERSMHEAEAIVLDLILGSVRECLPQIVARLDAVRLHGVEQAGTRWAGALGRMCLPGARLWGHGLDLAQLRALASAGIVFGPVQPDGARVAVNAGGPPQALRPSQRAIVIGAGLAGCAVTERLAARGWDLTLIERHTMPAGEASGNIAGIFMPQLSVDDNPGTRLTRAAYLFALRYWQTLGGVGGGFAGAQCGVLQLARDAAHADAQRAIAARHAMPHDFARWLDAPDASAHAGIGASFGAPFGAWWFAQAGWAHPGGVCAAMLERAGGRSSARFGVGAFALRYADQQWQVEDAKGALRASAPTVILANGNGARALAQARMLPLRAVRGQVTHLTGPDAPSLPCVVCGEGYVIPATAGVVALGATYDQFDDGALRATSQAENLRMASALLGTAGLGEHAPLAGRVGLRCVAPDRLPLVGALPGAPGLFALLGLASRGLVWAPLCAELLAAHIDGEPLPLPANLVGALDPGRFGKDPETE